MSNVNEEKRQKFMELAGPRVNNVINKIKTLEPMGRSTNYDFTKEDVETMFNAMQETLETTKETYLKKFETKELKERNTFSFGQTNTKIEENMED